METAERFARAAEACRGAPFLLHGRNRETGLDCVGLVGAALAGCGRRVRAPHGYGLRNSTIAGWLALAEANGLMPVDGPARRGDVLLTTPGPGQFHLLVVTGPDSWIHAHAGRRRVLSDDGRLPSALHHWRLREMPAAPTRD